MYVGCPGNELGLYDYTNRRLLLVNKATGAYSAMCQLPADAPQRQSFGMSYSNGYFWLLKDTASPYRWFGYGIVPSVASVPEHTEPAVRCYPVPANNVLQVAVDGTVLGAQVCDVLGRTQQLPMRLTASPAQLEVGTLPNGTYTLMLRTIDGTVRTSFGVAH